MISAQGFKHLAVLQEVIGMFSFRRSVQQWLHQEIVEDDPWCNF